MGYPFATLPTRQSGSKKIATAGLDTILEISPTQDEVFVVRGAIINFNVSKAALAQIVYKGGGLEMAFSGESGPIETTMGINGWQWHGVIVLKGGDILKLQARTNEANDTVTAIVFYDLVQVMGVSYYQQLK